MSHGRYFHTLRRAIQLRDLKTREILLYSANTIWHISLGPLLTSDEECIFKTLEPAAKQCKCNLDKTKRSKFSTEV